MKIAQRLMAGLVGICVLAAGATGTLYYLLERTHEHRRLELVGGLVADQVFGRFEAWMVEHRKPMDQKTFSARTFPPAVRRVFLLNAAGAVRVSSDPLLPGKTFSRSDPGCRECHRVPVRSSVPLGGVLRWARPLSAETSCRGCHAAAGPYLGCLVVDLDLSGYLDDLVSEVGEQLFMLLAMFGVIGWASFVFARRWISVRLEALAAVITRFESGDAGARAAVSGHDEITSVESGFNRMADSLGGREREKDILFAQLRTANSQLQRSEERSRQSFDVQRVLNDILRLSLGEHPLDAVLQRCLDLVLGVPWLSVEARGSIFVAEGEALVMRASRGLPPELLAECRRVRFGECLCGRAAAERRTVHTADVTEGHVRHHEGMTPHGHYCAPILSGQQVVGVLNLYLKVGHTVAAEEVTFLSAVANTLAGVIARSAAEERLRASEQRFRTLAEAAKDTIFIVDREQRLVFINGTGAGHFAAEAGSLAGKGIDELFPSGSAPLSGSCRLVLASGEAIYREDPFSFPGAELWLGTTLVALNGGEQGRAGVFGIARDITPQRESQAVREKLLSDLQSLFQVLSESHQEWRNTFDGITDKVSILNGDGRILKVNRSFAAHFDVHPRDIVGRRCCDFCIGGCCDSESCPLIEQARGGDPATREVFDPVSRRAFRVTIFPYASAGAQIDRFVRLAEDVTDERDRAKRLMLSERLASLGQVASGIAHEINNPLASIAGCAEALLLRIERQRIDPALFREYLDIVQEEVYRCKKITTAMLSLVRHGSYQPTAVRLDEALDRAIELVGFQGRLRSVSVTRDYQPALPLVMASEGELRQVLLTVLTNALDALDDQGTIACSVGANAGTVTVIVADSGAGIPHDVLGNIFTPFFTTKAAQGGTGLGLSIAKRIIDDVGGSIAIESRPGEGATVTITLPAAGEGGAP